MRFDGTLIKKTRMLKGWSQKRLAAAAAVDQATVCNIERGKTNNPENVKKVADVLGLEMESLLVEDRVPA